MAEPIIEKVIFAKALSGPLQVNVLSIWSPFSRKFHSLPKGTLESKKCPYYGRDTLVVF